MKELAAALGKLGLADVQTYIQSGNVLFKAAGGEEALRVAIAKHIEKKFKLAVPVVLRTARELEQAARKNPFAVAGADENRLHVMFLADKPPARAVAALDGNRSPPDEFVVAGREIYLSLLNGAGKTRLTNAWFDSQLATVSTMRNWRTTLKLLELARAK